MFHTKSVAVLQSQLIPVGPATRVSTANLPLPPPVSAAEPYGAGDIDIAVGMCADGLEEGMCTLKKQIDTIIHSEKL